MGNLFSNENKITGSVTDATVLDEQGVIDNQVAIIQNSAELFKTAPAILIDNQNKSKKAVAIGNKILTAIKESPDGMTPELDERANNFLVNCSTAVTQMKDSRASITQVMTQLAKMYTTVENQLDKTGKGTIAAQIQAERDKYAKEQHRLAEERRIEAKRIADKSAEAIQIRHDMHISFMTQFNDHLLAKKQTYLKSFNAITLENYEEKKTAMSGIVPNFQFKCEGPYCKEARHHDGTELKAFAQAVITENTPQVQATYKAEVTLAIADLIEKLPSKHAELTEEKRIADEQAMLLEEKRKNDLLIENANKKEKLRLQKIQDEKDAAALILQQEQDALAETKRLRELEETNKLNADAEQDLQEITTTADVKKAGDETLVMFEQESSIAEVNAPATRQGYEINVLHSAGWVQIFSLWYEKEGKTLALDKLPAVKMSSMKGFLEKLAHKGGEKIESKFLEYVPTHKAVNKK